MKIRFAAVLSRSRIQQRRRNSVFPKPFSGQTPSLGYFAVLSIKRLFMLDSSSEVQLEHGGVPTSPPCLMITMFHGENSVLHSMQTTYLRV
jgi:hypothetical protein